MREHRKFLISGRVQGVWYRAGTQQKARKLSLTGWARNLENGQVEVLAEGSPGALDALETWLWQGPPGALVERVDRVCVPTEGGEAIVDPPHGGDFLVL